MFSLVTVNLAQLIAASWPEARDVLSSMLGGCCTNPVFCNDLFLDHRVESCCETDEERRDAVLRHLLNGACVLQPDVPSCKSFSRNLVSSMHLSYDICALLLSAYKHKQVTLAIFRFCCTSIGLYTSGSNHGCDLSCKLQQRLTRWGPLCDCTDAVDMISCLESFGFGTLLELASLHGFRMDADTTDRDELRDVIVRHLIFGECQNTNTTLCVSICSALLQPAELNTPASLGPFILDAVINLGCKKTLQRALHCIEISHASTNPISVLRSLLS